MIRLMVLTWSEKVRSVPCCFAWVVDDAVEKGVSLAKVLSGDEC